MKYYSQVAFIMPEKILKINANITYCYIVIYLFHRIIKAGRIQGILTILLPSFPQAQIRH
jgi:hypothetical protein